MYLTELNDYYLGEDMRKLKKIWIILFVMAGLSLVTGASFHGFRMHPEDASLYNLGVTMGIVMITLFAFFLLAGIIVMIVDKRINNRCE